MENKKRGGTVRILLIVAALSLAVAGAARAYTAFSAKEEEKAEAARAAYAASNRLYDQVVLTDLAVDYPKTPEAVLNFYDDTVCLLYDSGVTDYDMLKTVLEKQRELYASELLELNSLDEQLEKLLDALKEVDRRKLTITSIEHADMYFDAQDPDLCVISSITHLKGEEADLYFNYYLKKDENGRYKILLRDPTDMVFNRVTTAD